MKDLKIEMTTDFTLDSATDPMADSMTATLILGIKTSASSVDFNALLNIDS